jgi:hypothetical protein
MPFCLTLKLNAGSYSCLGPTQSKHLVGSVNLLWKSLLFVTMLLAMGCGVSPIASRTSAAPPSGSSPTISISGNAEIRASSASSYSATVSGMSNTSVRWFVNGVEGGNSEIGLISNAGLFTAPTSTGSETISCVSVQDDSVKASVSIDILNPIPSISSVSVLGASNGIATVDIMGSGFVSQSIVTLEGALTSTTYISENELRASVAISADPTTVTLAVNNPDPGASDSNSIYALMPTSQMATLTGCDNPNTSQINGDWGPDVNAEYIALSNKTQLIGAPVYTSNAIFWMSRENAPGRSILMAGAFTGAPKTAKVAVIPSGTMGWKSLLAASSQSIPTKQQGTTGLSFIVPPGLGNGVYGFEIDDPTAHPLYGLANVPEIDWLVGVPAVPSPATALKTQVHDCAAEPGEILRIFGKNFVQSDRIILQPATGAPITINPSAANPTALSAQVPSNIHPGAYYLWIGNPHWDATSSPMAIIFILDASTAAVVNAACNSLVMDGTTDNKSALQQCLDVSAPDSNGTQIEHITLPAGDISLSSGIVLHPYQILSGASKDATRIIGKVPRQTPWLTLPQNSGLSDLSVTTPDGAPTVANLHCDLGYPNNTGHAFIMNVHIESTPVDGDAGTISTISLCGPDIQIYGSSFNAATFGDAYGVGFGAGSVISGNTFDTGNGFLSIGASQNTVVEENQFTSATFPSAIGNAAISSGRAFWHNGPSLISRNLYIGSNSFHDMGSQINNTVITTDGGGGSYYGTVTSSTSDTVTLANDPNWRWLGLTYPPGAFVVIIKGTGAGQYSPVSAWDERTVTVSKPWIVPPDSTSWVEIVFVQTNLSVVRNTFTDTINAAVSLGDSAELVIEDNNLTNAGSGIVTRAYGPYGGPEAFGPVLNADILRNVISVGTGNYIVPSPNTNRGGIGVFDGYGCISSGEMIRDNVLPSIQTFYNTNGFNGVSATVIENNVGKWYGPNSEQFLVQNNTAP